MRTLLIALLSLSLVPSIADANGGNGGGGGTKPTALIKVRNNGTSMLAVIVDPPSNIASALSAGNLSTSSFVSAGGRFVGRGGTTVFGGLRAGTHTVAGAYVSNASNSATVSSADSADVSISQGKSVNVTATGSVNSGASLSGP
jgi:hypothetical protein